MKILEAYYDLKLRNGMKKYLLAEGRSVTEIDKLYRQFGIYLTRIKSVTFYSALLKCASENEFKTLLNDIFVNKWCNHIEYKEMPGYFIRYLDYLHTACALDPYLNIEGLEIPNDQECMPLEEVTEYAKPYIRNNKLTIIANPLLIRKLRDYLSVYPLGKEDAIRITREFYGPHLNNMTNDDWDMLLEDLAHPKRRRKDKASLRNIAFEFKDGNRKIMSGNKAFEYIAKDVGANKLLNINVRHKGDKIVSRTYDPHYATYYKEIEPGLWLNLKGSVNDKVKTLVVLTSVLRLPYKVFLCNELVTEG